MFDNKIVSPPVGINMDNLDLSPLMLPEQDITIELHIRRLQYYWRTEGSVGAAISLFIWEEDLIWMN